MVDVVEPVGEPLRRTDGGPPAGPDPERKLFALCGADLRLQDVDQALRNGIDDADEKAGGLLEQTEQLGTQRVH